MAKVLIVEDDEVIGRGISGHLANAGFEPLLVARGETGLARLRFERPGRRRARPDASRHRRLGADRDGARRGDRHADPRRQRARHRAGPRAGRSSSARTTTSSSRSRCRSSSRASAPPRAAACARRRRRAASAIELEELLIDPREVQAYVDGVEREPHADGVPAALRARAGARPGRHARGADAADLGAAPAAPRPHRRRLRAGSCATRSTGRHRTTRSCTRGTGSATSCSRPRKPLA